MSFAEELRARAARTPRRVVLAEGGDPRVAEAARRLADEKIAIPIVVGGAGIDPAKDPRLSRVATLLRERRPDRVRDGIEALDLATDPVRFAAGLVALGEADAAVAGATHTTAHVIRAALWAIGTAPGHDTLSSAFYMALPDGRVLTFTDCAVVADPTPEQLARIALAAAEDRCRLVGDAPRVAFLSYSTRGSAGGPSVDKVRVATEAFRTLAPEILADGELQGDAALAAAVAERKAPGSPVGGQANVLVFPDLDAGNIAYKLVQYLAGASAAGPLFQGLLRPMSDLSRGASVDDIITVTAMVAAQATAAGS